MNSWREATLAMRFYGVFCADVLATECEPALTALLARIARVVFRLLVMIATTILIIRSTVVRRATRRPKCKAVLVARVRTTCLGAIVLEQQPARKLVVDFGHV